MAQTAPPKSTLIICSSNRCISPFAAKLLTQALAKDGQHHVVESAGLHTQPGYPSSMLIQTLAQRFAVDMSKHRTRPINEFLIQQAERIWVAETWQKNEIVALVPAAKNKVALLGQAHDLEITEPGDERLQVVESLAKIKVAINGLSLENEASSV